MMISTMVPEDHLHPDGSLARGAFRLRRTAVSAGRRRRHGRRRPAVAARRARRDRGARLTGDGYLDADNYLFIVDRAKDMIISGGFSIYSAEVEQAVMEHPAVQDCAVVGLPDDKWGERVTAVVQLHAGVSAANVTEVGIRDFVKARIGSVKAPEQVEVWPDLPRSKVGKVLKNEVRSQLLGTPHDRHG